MRSAQDAAGGTVVCGGGVLARLAAAVLIGGALAGGVLAGGVGCSSKPPAKALNVTPEMREVPPLLRNTIGSEVSFRGIEPVLVSGLGLVVGLNGTGGEPVQEAIAATMERQMGLMGVGKAGSYEGTAIEGKTPRQLLRDPNVAVVTVQAVIPPGAPQGATFDVYVTALNASSLEGGVLWSTDLRIGQPAVFGAVQSRQIALARGPIFVNPFSERGKEEEGVTRIAGRVLDGGVVTDPLGIEMVLNNTSFSRVRSIAAAINSRFPEMPGDTGKTARGRSGPSMQDGSGASIELRVPARYRREPAEFLQLVRHTRVEEGFPEQFARRYVEGLKAEPALGEELSWCLEALGTKALPILRELYDYPELVPQMAALKAGARLNDPLAATPLKQVAQTGSGSVRTRAIDLLGRIDAGPRVDAALRELLDEQDMLVRVAAYEALASRAERAQLSRLQRYASSNKDLVGAIPRTHLEEMARRNLPGNTLQGVERRFVEGKFFLDVVPGGEPLIYITQQGQPRIVLFGDQSRINTPLVMSAWNSNLMMTSDSAQEGLRVYYKANDRVQPVTATVKGGMPELIEFLARRSMPENPRPGLNMSYSDVVGAISEFQKAGGTAAAWATQLERLKGEIIAAQSSRDIRERPESPDDTEVVMIRRQNPSNPLLEPRDQPTAPTIVPIEPPVPESGKKPRE